MRGAARKRSRTSPKRSSTVSAPGDASSVRGARGPPEPDPAAALPRLGPGKDTDRTLIVVKLIPLALCVGYNSIQLNISVQNVVRVLFFLI